MITCALQEFFSYATTFSEALTQVCCASGVNRLTECFETLIIKICSTLELLLSLEDKVVDLRNKTLECKGLLLNALECAHNFVSRIEKCLRYGDLSSDRKKDIEERVANGDYAKLTNYINQLNRYFMQCDECYNDFKKLNDEAKTICRDSIHICVANKKLGRNVSMAGRVTKVLGVVVGGGGIVGAATVAGLFTFGIGTPIVLGIGAAAAGGAVVGGTATAVLGKALHSTGNQYLQLEEAFENIQTSFVTMQRVASDTDQKMYKLKRMKVNMKMNTENVTPNASNDDIETFKDMFEQLLEDIKKNREAIKEQQEKLEKQKKEVKNIE